MSEPVATYLHELREVREFGSGVKEESFYGRVDSGAWELAIWPRIRYDL